MIHLSATLAQMERSRRPKPSPTAPSVDDSKFGTLRASKPSSRAQSVAESDESDGDDANGRSSAKLSKSSSLSRKASKSGSRPQSRTERPRADSTATSASAVTERGKEKEKTDAKKMGIAGWASSISKMTGRAKNRGRADVLMGESDGEDGATENAATETPEPASARATPTKSKMSRGNTPNASPSLPSRVLKSTSQQNKKIAVALHDFAAASTDELSFKTGDQIFVLNEVVEGWWMGELSGTGKTGLFPTTYTEILNASTSSLNAKPVLPRRPSAGASALPPSISRASPVAEVKKPAWLTQPDTIDASDDDHPFGDNYIASSRTPTNGGFYSESVASSTAGDDDDDDGRHLMLDTKNSNDDLNVLRAAPPVPMRRPSNTSSIKKAPPPPPPPRRATTAPQPSALLAATQLQSKSRSNSSSRTNSTNTSYVSIPAAADEEFHSSPFDNPTDSGGCGDFKQNPFKPKGMCSNCFDMHG